MTGLLDRRLAVLLVILLGVALAVTGRTLLRPAGEMTLQPGGSLALAATLDELLDRPSVYELPGVAVFAPAVDGADAELASLGGILCDAITERLVETRRLRMVSCNSTRAAAQANLDGVYLAHLLGVDYAVDGELVREPDGPPKLRMQMRELRGATRVWSLEDDATPERVAIVVSRVSDRVLTSAGVDAAVDVTPIDPLLYGKYLRATQLARGNNEQRLEALQVIEEIVDQAPDYSPALYTLLALRSMTASFARPGEPDPEPEELAQRNAQRQQETRLLGERLLGVNPNDWRAHTLLMNYALEDGEWQVAFHHAERLTQGPGARPGGARIHAQLHLDAGYAMRARLLARLAAVADPLDAETYRVLAQAYGIAGDDEGMRSFAGIAAEITGHAVPLFDALLALRAGDDAAFVANFSQWLEAYYGDPAAARTVAIGVVDRAQRDEALVAIHSLPQAARMRAAEHLMEYALLGLPERSAEAVLAAAGRGPAGWLEQIWWPELAEMRAQPAFVEAMVLTGVTRLWDQEGAPDGCAPASDGGWHCR
jgi:tetratricopeptide (TPR) repeat protein